MAAKKTSGCLLKDFEVRYHVQTRKYLLACGFRTWTTMVIPLVKVESNGQALGL